MNKIRSANENYSSVTFKKCILWPMERRAKGSLVCRQQLFSHIGQSAMVCVCVCVATNWLRMCLLAQRPDSGFRCSKKKKKQQQHVWFTSVEINYSDFLVSWKNAAKSAGPLEKVCINAFYRILSSQNFVKKMSKKTENRFPCINTPLSAARHLNSIVEFNRQSGQFNLCRRKMGQRTVDNDGDARRFKNAWCELFDARAHALCPSRLLFNGDASCMKTVPKQMPIFTISRRRCLNLDNELM